MNPRLWPALLALLAATLAGGEAAPAAPNFERDLKPVLETYCYKCHNAEKSKGDVNLAQFTDLQRMLGQRKVWVTALKALREGEMPPEKAKQPAVGERAGLIAAIDRTINTLDCAGIKDPGKPALRRLNRTEYNNAVRALFGIDMTPAETFAPDSLSYGFDTIADSLTVSPVQIEHYYEAAGRILDAVAKQPKAMAQILFTQPSSTQPGSAAASRDAARAIIERFATRAFRHPVEPAQVERLLAIYDVATAKGRGFVPAVRAMLSAVLISPRFLIRVEAADPRATGPYPVTAYDLASRLSFFLWSGPPDDELLALAASGELTKGAVLEQQARRMLADPRSRALTENFASQWLRLSEFASHQPDAKRFPEFTPSLRQAMTDEAQLFINELISRDRPVTDLIDAGYTFLNEELAKHYGIDGVTGPALRRVPLQNRQRGGVLTMGATLTITSDTQRTSIPRRGNYVLGVLLGEPPPPPPAMVPMLEASKSGDGPKTLRELLEIHRRNPECATCHAKIDPLGFGLENFDAVGRWQDTQEGKRIDASGVLPSGATFDGPVELKKILLARKDGFARTMTEMMLIYALGRGLGPDDQCVVRDALAALDRDGYRISALVVTIVRSFPFTNRRNAGM